MLGVSGGSMLRTSRGVDVRLTLIITVMGVTAYLLTNDLPNVDPRSFVHGLLAILLIPCALYWPVPAGIALVAVLVTDAVTGTGYMGVGYFAAVIIPGITWGQGRRLAGALIAVGVVTTAGLEGILRSLPSSELQQTIIVEAIVVSMACAAAEAYLRLGYRVDNEVRQRREAAERERRAIARELHDTVVYATTMMVMRADAARLRGGHDPQTSGDLAFIADTGRQATEDLRSMLTVLRKNAAVDDEPAARDLGPWPEVLADQIQRLKLNGFEVKAAIPDVVLPQKISAALGRIATEAVSNATKYGDPDVPVQLMVDADESTAELLLINAIRPDRLRDHVPLGLVGLQEVVEAMDGALSTSETSGAWTLHARLPIRRPLERL